LKRPRVTENASIYIPDPEYRVSRIFEPKNRCETMAPAGETGLVTEIPCFPTEGIASLANKELVKRTLDELERLGLARRDEVLDTSCHYLANAYPVYSLDFEPKVKSLLAFLDQISNLEVVGRNGLFHYSHLHDQMRFARDLTRALWPSAEAAVPGTR
jgi:protoporphyrinogen oxidase